jgi:hypothetical protein
MYYIKLITKNNIVYRCHYDPDKDAKLFDRLIDNGYKIKKVNPSSISNHISLIFCDSIRESIQGLP